MDDATIIIEIYDPNGNLIRKFIKPPDPPARWHIYIGLAFGVVLAAPLFGALF